MATTGFFNRFSSRFQSLSPSETTLQALPSLPFCLIGGAVRHNANAHSERCSIAPERGRPHQPPPHKVNVHQPADLCIPAYPLGGLSKESPPPHAGRAALQALGWSKSAAEFFLFLGPRGYTNVNKPAEDRNKEMRDGIAGSCAPREWRDVEVSRLDGAGSSGGAYFTHRFWPVLRSKAAGPR